MDQKIQRSWRSLSKQPVLQQELSSAASRWPPCQTPYVVQHVYIVHLILTEPKKYSINVTYWINITLHMLKHRWHCLSSRENFVIFNHLHNDFELGRVRKYQCSVQSRFPALTGKRKERWISCRMREGGEEHWWILGWRLAVQANL